MKTLKPRSSAAVSRSLSSFKQNDRLFVLNQHVMFKDRAVIRYGTIKYIGPLRLPPSPPGYPDKANQNLFVGLLLDQRIDSKFDGVFLVLVPWLLTTQDRKLFDCSPGYGLLTVASSIFPIDGPPRRLFSSADLQSSGSLRRNGSLQKAPTPLPRRSALVTRSVVLMRRVDRSRRRRASSPPIARCPCIRASRDSRRFCRASRASRARKARR